MIKKSPLPTPKSLTPYHACYDHYLYMSSVKIYSDPPVNLVSYDQTLRWCRKVFAGNTRFSSIDLNSFETIAHADILVLPGGDPGVYADNLLGSDHATFLKKWIEKGGRCIGICAGAYILSKNFSFQSRFSKESDDKILGIGVFDGDATGPHFCDIPFVYESNQGLRVISVENEYGKKINIIYNGGCGFTGFSQDAEVIWKYPDGTVCAIRSEYVYGQVLLFGVHPEISSRDLNPKCKFVLENQLRARLNHDDEKIVNSECADIIRKFVC